MSDQVLVAIITSGLTLVGVILTVFFGNRKTEKKVSEKTDLTLYRINQLEIKQDKHNEVIERVYKLEDRANLSDEKYKEHERRLKKLEVKI